MRKCMIYEAEASNILIIPQMRRISSELLLSV